MTYAAKLEAAAARAIPILKKIGVEQQYLRFDGSIEIPSRFYPPSQSDTKFQAEQALGDWAENSVRAAINRATSGFSASHFGYNSKILAEDENFREEYIAGIIETCTYGKRADLLVFKNGADVPESLTGMNAKAVKPIVQRCVGALEVRSSRLNAQQYIRYQSERKAAGKKPTSMEPNFTVKIEDLVKVFLWIYLNDKPQAYVQVFFDEIYAIGFLEIVEYIVSAPKLRVEKHKRSAKTTIMVPISEGHLVGKVTALPTFSISHNVTKNGRHDIFAAPSEGAMELDVDSLIAILK